MSAHYEKIRDKIGISDLFNKKDENYSKSDAAYEILRPFSKKPPPWHEKT